MCKFYNEYSKNAYSTPKKSSFDNIFPNSLSEDLKQKLT